MPTTEQNLTTWDQSYDWTIQGDEWSDPWGTAEAQWYYSLLPRIRRFVPAPRIVEIAPGHGRWTQFLAPLADQLTIVDLSPACIEVCKRRFSHLDNIAYSVNDGLTLPDVEANSVDFVFSFDSLVHVEADVVRSYLGELHRVLNEDGVGVLHHSNIGSYDRSEFTADSSPESELDEAAFIARTHWRAFSMSAAKFAEQAVEAGLSCVGQELIAWDGARLIDAVSVVTRPGSRNDRDHRLVENPWFMDEARSTRVADWAFGGGQADKAV